MKKIFVGIDVAKDSSNGHGLNAEGETLFSLAFTMNSEGFSKLLDELKSKSWDLSEVLVAMESTACYHINLFSFLTANGVNAVVINPLLISNFARLSLRKTKTDKKDASTIAQFAMIQDTVEYIVQHVITVPMHGGLLSMLQITCSPKHCRERQSL